MNLNINLNCVYSNYMYVWLILVKEKFKYCGGKKKLVPSRFLKNEKFEFGFCCEIINPFLNISLPTKLT